METKQVGACSSAIAAGIRAAAPRLRKDATRNRERILAAARRLFADEGADVPLDEIAKQAGVGNATLYRNFPDRTALVHQVTLSVLERGLERAREALADPGDPFEAISRFAHGAADEQIGALCSMLSEHPVLRDDEQLFATRLEMERVVEELMARARAAGVLRPDVGPGDLLVALARLTRPLPGSENCLGNEMFVRRHLQLFLDGLRSPARSVLPGRAATLEDLRPTFPADPLTR
ncbi:TetR/AcrR family transcriptional regulator [Kitasatospora sp. NBC_01287]|uniref:TetR/AcrR family transcriptional regulator n=1 Tax=Kitasatospora sp. NBC_01287 TaxID=2903573 RepID=UPI00224F5C2F|nr:TetR/AcrR family transcriptional regulator [Kitasatospora sp. NBC_01287]MCX4745474.1 TetR/AcrR family transcriptional regulator [Kitasatospora sp. NBC_01287]